MKKYINHKIITASYVALIVLTVYLTYGDMLNYFFTSTDTMTLIQRGRIQSFNDVLRIFSEPLGDNLPFYRPVSTLSFSLDYSIWKLNPFGYHLTDLILHCTVSILVFFLFYLLTNGKQFTALLGSLLFTTHPIIVEVVPAIARRQEILSAMFIILSLIFFIKHLSSSSHKKTFFISSLVFYILALGSKETSVIFPIMIFAYSIVTFPFYSGESAVKRVFQALNMALPSILISIPYILWRAFLLGGIGGYSSNMPTQTPLEIINNYFLYLFYPVDFLNLSFMSDLISYIFFVFFLAVSVSGLYHRNKIKDFIITLKYGSTLLFLTLWLLVPLSIYIFTSTFSPRYMYFSAIPFCIIISMLMAEAFHAAVRRIKDCGLSGMFRLSALFKPAVSSMILLSGLAISLLSYSPIIRDYGEWEGQATVSSMLFSKLSDIIYELPNNTEITIHDRPVFFIISGQKHHHVQTAVNLNEYSIKSWLDLMLPDNHFRIIRNGEVISADPYEVGIEIEMEDRDKADVIFTYRNVPDPGL